jgi:sulfur relay protein TusB/DsrH
VSKYVLIESRDPFDSADVGRVWDLAEGLVANGDEVTVYLVQNGVLPARAASSAAGRLSGLAETVTVLADDFSLRERGIGDDELAEGVGVSDVGSLVDLLVGDGTKVLWH